MSDNAPKRPGQGMDSKMRIILLLVGIVASVVLLMFVLKWKDGGVDTGDAQLGGAPVIDSVPGAGNPTSNYIKAVQQSNVEQAEAAVRALGVRQLRVRHHSAGRDATVGDLARIEVEAVDFERLLARREELIDSLNALGYTYVTLDIAGFRSGSMNEVLEGDEKDIS